MNRILHGVHASHWDLFGEHRLHHYWSADESEWATDVMFQNREQLASVYPQFVQRAITSFGCQEVLHFLGRKPVVSRHRTSEITSHLGSRVEGTRVKHAINRNSIKMYDKQGTILRVETTINHTREMKVFRASENDPQGEKSWQRMRKGVADLNRRCQISDASNNRYLESLASTETELTLAETVESICRATHWKGRSVRALNPLAIQDTQLLRAVNRGEFSITGFRNRDLRQILFGDAEAADTKQKKSQAAKITRMIRMLRAHGLVKKVPKSHRYQLTLKGRQTINTILNATNANAKTLEKMAA